MLSHYKKTPSRRVRPFSSAGVEDVADPMIVTSKAESSSFPIRRGKPRFSNNIMKFLTTLSHLPLTPSRRANSNRLQKADLGPENKEKNVAA